MLLAADSRLLLAEPIRHLAAIGGGYVRLEHELHHEPAIDADRGCAGEEQGQPLRPKRAERGRIRELKNPAAA